MLKQVAHDDDHDGRGEHQGILPHLAFHVVFVRIVEARQNLADRQRNQGKFATGDDCSDRAQQAVVPFGGVQLQQSP